MEQVLRSVVFFVEYNCSSQVATQYLLTLLLVLIAKYHGNTGAVCSVQHDVDLK